MAELLRTGEAARNLGCSRQHVLDLIQRGELTNHGHGAQRLLDRSEVEALAGLVRPSDERERLWLHYVVAGKIAMQPAKSLARARKTLHRLATAVPGGTIHTARWTEVLARGVESVLRAVTAEGEEADALRRDSPFVELLSDVERARARQGFGYVDRHPPDEGTAARSHRRIRRFQRRLERGDAREPIGRPGRRR